MEHREAQKGVGWGIFQSYRMIHAYLSTVNPLINSHGGLFLESILGWGFIRGGGLLEVGAYSYD